MLGKETPLPPTYSGSSCVLSKEKLFRRNGNVPWRDPLIRGHQSIMSPIALGVGVL